MRFTVDRLDHVVVNCRDVEESASWYQRVLGMEREDFGPDNRIALKFGGQKLNLRPQGHDVEKWVTAAHAAAGAMDLCFITGCAGGRRGQPPGRLRRRGGVRPCAQDRRAWPDPVGVLPGPRRQPDRDRVIPVAVAGEFDFDLPPGCIAAEPARPRDAARLLLVRELLQDKCVSDLPGLLRPGDLLVANDTRVIHAQLHARRGAARIGLTLDQPRPDGTWHALARNARRIQPGDTLAIEGADGFEALVLSCTGGSAVLRFNQHGDAFRAALAHAGALALPPYIPRPHGPTADDAADYQTVFARHEGAVAAPTAGLHFTPALLDALTAAGIGRVTVTLHVGAGTFLPVRDADPAQHRMHAERGILTAEAAEAINAAQRVVAVGTTSLRLLESAVDDGGACSRSMGTPACSSRRGSGSGRWMRC